MPDNGSQPMSEVGYENVAERPIQSIQIFERYPTFRTADIEKLQLTASADLNDGVLDAE